MSKKQNPTQNTTPQVICTHPDDVKHVVALPDYALEVEFFDGTKGKVLMKEMLFSPKVGVFKVLRDIEKFNQVFIDHGAVTWPGELDLAPDSTYTAIKENGVWILK